MINIENFRMKNLAFRLLVDIICGISLKFFHQAYLFITVKLRKHCLLKDPKPSFDVNITSEKLILYQLAVANIYILTVKIFLNPIFRPLITFV